MKELKKTADECISQLRAIGINCGNVRFTVNSRAKKRWGQCKVISGDTCEISISDRLLADSADELALKNTIIHELLYAADKCLSGHRGRWLAMAGTVMKAYPQYDIKRCTSAEEKGFSETYVPTKKLEYSYFFRCLGCGTEAKYKKATKFTRNPLAYVCVKCRGKFIPSADYDRLSPSQRRELNERLKNKY